VPGETAVVIVLPCIYHKRKIHTMNWTRTRKPIPRSKLAHEIARKLDRYLNHMSVRSHSVGIDATVRLLTWML
jgi:hypothetical protein